MKDGRFTAEKIRSEYISKEPTKVQELKELDKKVKNPVNIFSYVYGSVSAIVMGSGMSLVMTDIGAKLGMGDTMIPGIIIGVVGLGLALLTYPIYKKLLSSRRKKYADQIIAISESIINEQ